jgi:EAL domain-containing protein (putative c-di-GMP-specific phosphodiesterase class I)
VETRAQLEFLKCHGCDEGQGYYFSRPVSGEQAGKLIGANIREAVGL